MKPLIVIPARGGSKGLPGKNIKPLNGKPLINYTIEAAKALFSDDIICVSTDDPEIKNLIEREAGLMVPFLRPANLASDTASTNSVLLHAIEYYETIGYFPDMLILLQPTSPFRNSTHIQEAIKVFSLDFDMVVSVKETKANPYYLLFEEDENGFLNKSKQLDVTRRQDCPKVWEYNGAIYVINIGSLKKMTINEFTKVKKYIMDDISSIDIDDQLDWLIAEALVGYTI